jgi:hypothetical protein
MYATHSTPHSLRCTVLTFRSNSLPQLFFRTPLAQPKKKLFGLHMPRNAKSKKTPPSPPSIVLYQAKSFWLLTTLAPKTKMPFFGGVFILPLIEKTRAGGVGRGRSPLRQCPSTCSCLLRHNNQVHSLVGLLAAMDCFLSAPRSTPLRPAPAPVGKVAPMGCVFFSAPRSTPCPCSKGRTCNLGKTHSCAATASHSPRGMRAHTAAVTRTRPRPRPRPRPRQCHRRWH